MEIKFKNIKEKQVAYIIATGRDNIPYIFGELIEYIIKNNILTIEHYYCTFFNNTINVDHEELHYEIGIPITGDVSGEGRIQIKKIPENQVVSTIHKGSYNKMNQVYHTLLEHAVKNGYLISGPATEIYINSTPEVLRNEVLVEVRFPVIKK
ncbi:MULTISPECIES: GyrI-like domain-containing protein [Methanobacterium]|jgi:effector-binding domain-containing protein|uniref:GyrI-like domain-containing protein n=1 Tax=Methanobacterium veterum TaxID=408577 RepID=A0A9E5DKW4_9EURY|nr:MULTISPECIES: GyrI-like domain-containing protein [Methanobacterium]MCZ3365219.1 GyrI-like domain-containing protein [Methanobacterium veterum]MCZ3372974.1 GyrI-like domain-containing protein [Methanobacterium veterum]